jgi:hypothetical protein
MVSVENFYWILYQNLLEPSGLDCWRYYPFGTKQNLALTEFWQKDPRHLHSRILDGNHVLFHFDQEPLDGDFGTHYDSLLPAWSNKFVKLLANSEHSDQKQHLCQDRGMMDWYYFYHGFAALHWFRDSRYVRDNSAISKVFCSLNHLTTGKRSYRMSMLARLIDRGLLSCGDVSFHATASACQKEVESDQSPLCDSERDLISRTVLRADSLPLILDHVKVNGDFSARFGYKEYQLWQRSLWHLVNETVFYDQKLHLTEKIFKPIVATRPFVLIAAPGNLAYLRSYGFKTFDAWIDESYDTMTDHQQRLDHIANELLRISRLGLSDLRNMYEDMRPVLEYNKNHFFTGFREQISCELVDNFESCIRIWNNGRLDGREMPIPDNLSQVKKLLIQ